MQPGGKFGAVIIIISNNQLLYSTIGPDKLENDQQIPLQDASRPEKIRKNESSPISGEEKRLAAPHNIYCPKAQKFIMEEQNWTH